MTYADEEENNKEEYEKLRKLVLSEAAFLIRDKESEQIYQIAKQYYGKLLARCPLHKHLSSLSPPPADFLNNFVKLSSARDNLGRAMRMKPLKSPLENPSVRKGISFVRRFFLKRALICQVLSSDPDLGAAFIIPSKLHKKVLESVVANPERHHSYETPITACRLSLPSPAAPKWKASASRLRDEGVKPPMFSDAVFDSEIIKADRSIFGEVVISATLILFTEKTKDLSNPNYRLGSQTLISSGDCGGKIKHVLRFCEMSRVMVRQYNMVQQGIEFRMRDQKCVFLVLFSEDRLKEFLANFRRQTLDGRKYRIDIIEDPRREFFVRKFTEEWKKRKVSSFEYLMQLNDYSSRSFQSLSQYPVFPWVLQNYTDNTLAMAPGDFRDLHYPMAGITPRKRNEAVKKYENTDDFPEGRFQFGAHYLPGRAVLGYLMRQQPYTLMIYRFDSGGDCPTRHFHIMNTMWQNANEQSDTNLELVPEFYYNPEFLANQYSLNP